MKRISSFVLFFVLLSLIMINTIAYACPMDKSVNLENIYGVYKGMQIVDTDPCLYIILASDSVCYFITYYPESDVFSEMCKTTYVVYGDTILLAGNNIIVFVFKAQDNKLVYKTYDGEGNVVQVGYEKQNILVDDFIKSVLGNYIN